MNANVDISNVCLETERLLLRPWTMDDANDMYEYAKVDGVGQMAGWNPHTSPGESKEIVRMFIEEKKVFAIECKENHKVIGTVGLENAYIDLGEPYTHLLGREIGYVLSKDYWGYGIMPEAVKRVIKYCFKEEHYEFLQCSHSVQNNQSRRVIEKCGFEFVKECARTGQNGEVKDTRFYVIRNERR